MLIISLLKKYETSLDAFEKRITMITGSAAVINLVANPFVSTDIHTPDETWMRCLVLFLSHVMEHDISICVTETYIFELSQRTFVK